MIIIIIVDNSKQGPVHIITAVEWQTTVDWQKRKLVFFREDGVDGDVRAGPVCEHSDSGENVHDLVLKNKARREPSLQTNERTSRALKERERPFITTPRALQKFVPGSQSVVGV